MFARYKRKLAATFWENTKSFGKLLKVSLCNWPELLETKNNPIETDEANN